VVVSAMGRKLRHAMVCDAQVRTCPHRLFPSPLIDYLLVLGAAGCSDITFMAISNLA